MRLDRARRAFYRRVERGGTPGYPRFKTHNRWRTIELGEPARGMVTPGRVRIKGLPTLRFRSKASLPDPGQVRALTITKRGRRVFVNLTYAVEREPLSPSSVRVGIDMGVSDRMVLSTGERVGQSRRPSAGLERAQRRLLRCAEGSGTWRERRAVLANQQHRERVRNRNECHRLTTEIVRRFGLIAVGDLVSKEGSAAHGAGTDVEFAAGAACVQGRVGQSRVRQGGLTPYQRDVLGMWSGRLVGRMAVSDLNVLIAGTAWPLT